MINRKVIKHIDERHRVPANGTSPEIGRPSRFGISPLLLSAFVVTVIKQARFGIDEVFFDQGELPGNIIKVFRLLIENFVFSVKRRGHVQTVEPHLVRVSLLVPKAVLLCAGLAGELSAERVGGFTVLVATGFGLLTQRQQHPSARHIIEVVFIDAVRADAAIGSDVTVHVAQDVVVIAGVGGAFPNPL